MRETNDHKNSSSDNEQQRDELALSLVISPEPGPIDIVASGCPRLAPATQTSKVVRLPPDCPFDTHDKDLPAMFANPTPVSIPITATSFNDRASPDSGLPA
jgi:hypothetical protein